METAKTREGGEREGVGLPANTMGVLSISITLWLSQLSQGSFELPLV